MKFTLSWLKSHLETNASAEEIANTLTNIGLEVEELSNPLKNLAGFITAKVETCEMHPDSDHLHIILVNNGQNRIQVVCGAPNCKAGMVGVFAPVGTNIPLYNEKLKVGKIRGIESNGMMCSEKELLIGDDHSGIIELPADTKIGVPASEVLNADVVFEVNVLANRAECLGVRGIARDLAAAGLGSLKPLEITPISSAFKSPIKVKIEDFESCPTYVARYIKGVNNKAQTPQWMKDRLTAIGLRPISPLVDITNYICYDIAHPLHVFDADKLKGNIVVRMAQNGEKFTSLEGKEYALDGQSLGICDDDGIECLGGIMGGAAKGCAEDTVNVLLESALFAPNSIARTGRKFQIDSDSRYRYERWVDPMANVLASNYATQLILQICGGEASEIEMAGAESEPNNFAYISPADFKKLIGYEVTAEQIKQILSKLGFKLADENGKIKAVSPSWRGDIHDTCDLIEEVVRIIGFDKIEAQSLAHNMLPKPMLSAEQDRVVKIKHKLAACGMFETVTWSFTDSQKGKMFRKAGAEPILITNPIASDLNEVRPSVLPNLLQGAKNNIARGYADVALFEVGPVFWGTNPTEQNINAAGILTGNISEKHWLKGERAYDVFDAKAMALAAISATKGPAESLQVTTDAPAYYHPSRSGTLRLGKNAVAYFGEIHPNVCKAFGIKQRVTAFEVNVDNIPLPRVAHNKNKKKIELSAFQPLAKDLAFMVDEKIAAADILATAKNADREFITSAQIFDVYQGANLPEGKKSVALSVVFQPKDKTLTDAEIETLMNKVSMALKNKFAAELRDK